MANAHTFTAATQVLTLTDNFDTTETVTIGLKVYTINATVGSSDGSVDLGTDAEGSLENLCAAINLNPLGGETGVADADYASGMTVHPDVVCSAQTATTITIQAKTPGTVGNAIITTETHGEGSWAAALMTGGVGDLETWVKSELDLNQINSEVITDLRAILPTDVDG